MGIFKAYDVRGLTPKEINPELAYRIGRCLVPQLSAQVLVVGYDMRDSSPDLAEAMIRGITEMGCDVLNLGLATTPQVSYVVGKEKTDGGVMITASHNPAGYNGFKICGRGPASLSGDSGLKELEAAVQQTLPEKNARTGQERPHNCQAAYVEHVWSVAGSPDLSPLADKTIVIDAGNGMGGHVLPDLLENFPGNVVPMFYELDGNFPNHEANPLKEECIADLKARVMAEQAFLGVALDGDGDRCAFVDSQGQTVPCDLVTALLAEKFLKSNQGSGIVYDLRSSKIVPEVITRCGGRPLRERVGHSLMKATLRAEQGVFGGELSGHYYFRDHYYSDSGAVALAVMLATLSEAGGETLETLLKPYQKYSQSGEVNFEVEDKDGMIASLAQQFSDGQIDHLDGITVEYPSWWFNVRKSNTEPILRLNLEADTEQEKNQRLNELLAVLGKPL